MDWTVYLLRKTYEYPEGTWEKITTKDSQRKALAARAEYVRLNPGAITMVDKADAPSKSWSVYEMRIGERVWRRMSTWDRFKSAQAACRVKRMNDSAARYEVFPTGEAPDPTTEEVDIALARRRRETAEKIAQAIYDGQIGKPQTCRARRQGEEGIRSRCMLMEDHIPAKHQTAYDIALEQLRKADQGPELIVPEGAGTTAGRQWMPSHSRDGREANSPFRPGDPGEDPAERDEVRPADEGYAPGDPRRGIIPPVNPDSGEDA